MNCPEEIKIIARQNEMNLQYPRPKPEPEPKPDGASWPEIIFGIIILPFALLTVGITTMIVYWISLQDQRRTEQWRAAARSSPEEYLERCFKLGGKR